MDVATSSSDSDEQLLFLTLGGVYSTNLCQKKRRKKRSVWSRPWLLLTALIAEWRTEDPLALKNFIRMDETHFNRLSELVSLYIQKNDTNMR